MRGLSLDEAVYERIRSVTPAGDVQIAASGESGTGDEFSLLFAFDESPRRVVFAADLEQSDVAHRDDLPRLLANSIAWLRPAVEQRVGTSRVSDHELRKNKDFSPGGGDSNSHIFSYPWWYWPCWYLSLALAVAFLPIEWWLYQRRIIA